MKEPIITEWDWTAYRDPEKLAGFGASEEAAIANLLELEDA